MQRFTLCISALMSLLTGVDSSEAVDLRQPVVQRTQSSPYYDGSYFTGSNELVTPLYQTPANSSPYSVQYQSPVPTITNFRPTVAPIVQPRQNYWNSQPNWGPSYPVQTPVYYPPLRTRTPSYALPIQGGSYTPRLPVAPFRCDPSTGCRGY